MLVIARRPLGALTRAELLEIAMKQILGFACSVPIGRWHDFLPAALSSLNKQKHPVEIALLDASSDARVVDAVREIELAYHRIGPDNGQAAAIAEGWSHTSSEIIFWLNTDDRLLPGALERVASIFNEMPDIDVVFGSSHFLDETGATTGCHDQVEDVSPLLLRSNTISQPSCFVRRRAVDNVGGLNTSLQYIMDWDLWVRLYQAGARFHRIDEALSAVYMGAGTKTDVVNFRRLKEIYRLVHCTSGHWSAIKSTLSVARHTVFSP